jgi:hypothetical protein
MKDCIEQTIQHAGEPRDKISETIVYGFRCQDCAKEKVMYVDVSIQDPPFNPQCCGKKLELKWRDKVITHTKVYPLGV